MHGITIEKTVYLVRHGESEANAQKTFQFPTSPLTEKGVEQARKIAQRASKLEFEILISSPYVRAQQTAEFIAKETNRIPEYIDLFVERIKPSAMTGQNVHDERTTALYREWENSLYSQGLKAEDGENYEDLVTRADKALKFLEDKTEKSVLVVTHGFFLRTMLARIVLGETLSPESFKNLQCSMSMKNTGLSVFHLARFENEPPRWRLAVYNDHSHLG